MWERNNTIMEPDFSMLAEAEIKSAEPATPGKKSAKHVALKSAIAKMTEDVESARKELEGLRTNLTGRFAATVPKEGEDKPEAGKVALIGQAHGRRSLGNATLLKVTFSRVGKGLKPY